MSKDKDAEQRLWLSLGYGGKRADPRTWRYWKKPGGAKQWVIAAPNDLAEFEQHDKTVFYQGKQILEAATQWSATWRTLAYFYEHVIPTVPRPPLAASMACNAHDTVGAIRSFAPFKPAKQGASIAIDVAVSQDVGNHRRKRDASYAEKVWVGPAYPKLRILVLGESWYGDFPEDLVTDDGYIRAYLDGRVKDPMYTRMANACGFRLKPEDFWNGIMFTNFVQRVGDTRESRPASEHYKNACPRLECILEEHKPRGVWILGIEQARYSAPVVEKAGAAFQVSAHPTSYGLKNATLDAGWTSLLAKIKDGVHAQ